MVRNEKHEKYGDGLCIITAYSADTNLLHIDLSNRLSNRDWKTNMYCKFTPFTIETLAVKIEMA